MKFARENLKLLGRTWMRIRPWTRHSLVLLVAGAAYTGVGITYVTDEGRMTRQALVIALSWMPIQAWGVLFIIVGLGTMVSARWPPTAEKWGYMIMTGLSSGWGSFYFMGVIFVGNPLSSLSLGFVWYLLAFMWWAISGLTNPPVKVVIRRGPGKPS